MSALKTDPAEIRRALGLLCEPGEVYEVRAPNTQRGTISGYFDDPEKLAHAAMELNCSPSAQVGQIVAIEEERIFSSS